jgi:predicted pyridoxine 5'-phosphate oxidase superfamily flavin-nucleotide-binding protein
MSKSHITDVAFTPAVKAVQDKLGTRAMMERMSETRGFQTEITEDFAGFLAHVTSFYLGTASAEGQPYIQHRGGPAGFITATGDKTFRFPDFKGNKQYITLGNLSENDRVALFFMNYETKTRVKVWGRARVVDLDSDARAIEVTIEAWDPNCPQHIPDLFSEATVRRAMGKLAARVEELEAELAALKS